jgi:two-component system sensor histidine kinase PhoQ
MRDLARVFNSLNSLRTRIMVSALLVIVVVLPSIGIALNNAFEQQVRANVQDQLNAYFYSVLAVTEIENDELLMPEVLLENQFNVINSGLYALITRPALQSSEADTIQAEILWTSTSFLGASISEQIPAPKLGQSQFSEIAVNGEAHFIYSYSVRFDNTSDINQASSIITLHIVKDLFDVLAQQQAFSQKLWLWLLVLIVVLLFIQAFWLTWTLKPLALFEKELNAVRTGETEQLLARYPSELDTVAKQLNGLLSNEQKQRQRYRNALSDLAHSLKTPLAAILSQQDLSAASMEQVQQINRTITHQLKRAQSAGNKAWHLGINVAFMSDKLLRTLSKIYPDIAINYAQPIDSSIVFHGDEADFSEMLGNLLDNACKAAKSKVHLSIYVLEEQLKIVVEDDGKGVDSAQQAKILERGKRADTYEHGHGIGLAIVCDLVDNYSGSLTIASSAQLGGAKFILTFLQQ